MARSFIVYQGEDETPEFDLTEPDSPVHVIWEEIEAGGRAFQGESTTNSIPLRDEQGGTGNELSLPSGIDFISLSRGSRWVWMDGPDGDEVILASGRIGTKDYSRGRQKADRAREVVIQAADRNEELTEIIIDDWVRPEETDVARVNALITDYLSGTPRSTTVLASTYVSADNTITMPAKTYDGTNPKDILSEIALQANKLFFVTVDDEVFYDTADSTVYQAGIRISDRIDELNQDAACSSTVPTIVSSGYVGSGTSPGSIGDVPVLSNGALVVVGAWFYTGGPLETPFSAEWTADGTPYELTRLASACVSSTSGIDIAIEVFYLLDPPEVAGGDNSLNVVSSNDGGVWKGYFVLEGVNQSDPFGTPDTSSGSGASSSGISIADGDLLLNAVFGAVIGSHSEPTPDSGQTQSWTESDNPPRFGGGYGDATPTWTFDQSVDWVAMGLGINGASAGEGSGTFPPIWDVGPSSTEDGLELVSGLRLYYGQDGAYVYVNHADTANSYWHAERSFYTQDPAIDDSTKATALAEAMLTRLRFEERTYNVSIGPLNEDQIGCLKPGQLIQIKARAIPDADDQFRSRRIAQLKWTTPRPGVFFARMQLDRPIKELPYGIGAKEGHDALEQHKEGDSHPASAIVVTDADGNFTGTDVEAVLDELFDAIGGGGALDDLSDVTITSAAEHDALRYDGAEWINDPGYWEPVTDGDVDATELVFEDGDVVMEWVT